MVTENQKSASQDSFWHYRGSIVFVTLVAGTIGWFANAYLNAPAPRISTAIREKSGDYTYINPLLLCGTNEPKASEEYDDLGNKLKAYIADAEYQGKATRVSVYYRDLLSGRWTGANENEKYSPASLLKVPTMLAVLKASESNPDLLYRKVYYSGSFDDNQAETYKPTSPLLPGNTYTIEVLIKAMIEESDNNATRLLNESLNDSYFREIYTDLGMSEPTSLGTVDFMSVKLFSYFFRILYNSSYLDRNESEKALGYLAKSTFMDGIRAGVPKGTVVAEKFGEREIKAPAGNSISNELHDCGIIYYPDAPYILCIMTEGPDHKPLPKIIRDISDIVYQNQMNVVKKQASL